MSKVEVDFNHTGKRLYPYEVKVNRKVIGHITRTCVFKSEDSAHIIEGSSIEDVMRKTELYFRYRNSLLCDNGRPLFRTDERPLIVYRMNVNPTWSCPGWWIEGVKYGSRTKSYFFIMSADGRTDKQISVQSMEQY